MKFDDLGRSCGYLEIDEKDKRKKFENRFFILDKSKGVFVWHPKEPATTSAQGAPCGLIRIDYITKVEVATKSKFNFCFVVNTPFRPYFMKANNQDDLNEWVETLNNAGKIIVPQEALRSLQTQSSVEESRRSVSEESPNQGAETDERFTYRTEIVGGVVLKKKVTSDGHIQKNLEEIHSPVPVLNENSESSNFSFLQPSPTSLKTTSIESVNHGDVIKKGWAVKQGHVRKNWKRRYFILTNDNLSYFKTENDIDSIRKISICDILTAKPDDNKQKQRDNLLFIATTDKIYYMQTDTPEDMTSWINCIQKAIKQNRVNSQKKKVFATKSNTRKTDRDNKQLQLGIKGPASSLHGMPTSPIPVVPTSQHFSSQVLEMNFGIERSESTEILREPSFHSSNYLKKRASANSIFRSFSSHEGGEAGTTSETVECIKPHQRSGSAADILAPYSMSVAKRGSLNVGKSQAAVSDSVEEVSPKTNKHVPLIKTNSNQTSHRLSSKKGLDPIVDHRAAVKPSSVKKKKNSGILFSLNTMLYRKVENMRKKRN